MTCLKKGNTLTRIQDVSIGKAHETTNQEVQECCLKPPVSDSTNTILKGKPHKGLMCNYYAKKKGSHSFANKRHCPAWGAVCNLCKIKNTFKDSKECKRLQKEKKPKPGNQKQSGSTKKPFVLKVDEDGEGHFYEVVDKIGTLNQQCDHRKAFANLLISKTRICVNFQIGSGSTCSILPVGVYKEISGDHDLQDLNTTVRPTLSLYDEKTKIKTLGTRKEVIIQFRIVNEDLTPLIGLSDSEELKLIELPRENIATLDSGKPHVPSSALELHTPLTMANILSKYPAVFDNSVGKLGGELHLYTKEDVTPSKAAPREIHCRNQRSSRTRHYRKSN